MAQGFVVRWIGIGILGTVVGLGAAGFIGLMGIAADSFAAAVTAGIMFGAAVGVSIGLAQGIVLSSRLEEISATRWATFTAAGAALAWAAVAYPIGLLIEPDADPSWSDRILWGIAIGLTAGAIVGAVQWLDMRRALPDSRATIAVEAFAWMVGGVVLIVADGLIRNEVPERLAVGLAVAALGVAGGIVALIQGTALDRILPDTSSNSAESTTRPS